MVSHDGDVDLPDCLNSFPDAGKTGLHDEAVTRFVERRLPVVGRDLDHARQDVAELKRLPLIERVSPGVASQMPVWIISPRVTSCGQVLKDGSPLMRRSGKGFESRGETEGLVSMVFSRVMDNLSWLTDQ